MKRIEEWKKERKKEVEILEKAKILNVFFLTTKEVEIRLDRKENLGVFLESTETNKEFLGNLFSKLVEINFSRLRKIVIFKKASENPKDWTGGRLYSKNLDMEFRINLCDPRYEGERPEVQVERIKIIYLWGVHFFSSELKELKENISEFRKIIQQSGILERLTKYLGDREEEIKRISEKLLDHLTESYLEIVTMSVNISPQQEAIEMIKKVTSLRIRSFQRSFRTSSGYASPFEVGNLALCFEEASFFQDIKLQGKIRRVINRLNHKMLREVFDDFRKIYIEVKNKIYSRETEAIFREILIPEMPNEYKKILLQKVGQKFQSNQLLKEMEKIQDVKDGDEEIKKIVEKMVKNGVRKEDFEEAFRKIWG